METAAEEPLAKPDPQPGEAPAPWWKCVVARWIVYMMVYWAAVNVVGLPDKIGEWAGLRSVLWAGALYFLALGAIELSGFYLRTVPRRAHRIHMSLRRG